MARDFENMQDLESLTDEELREVVREHLDAHNGLDVQDFSIRARDGVVTLAGRVGTDGESRIAERIITDVLGVEVVKNELVVDSLRRAESPNAIDDHLQEEICTEGLLLGDRPVSLSDESAHLADSYDDEDGTAEVGRSIEGAEPWVPPESPTQEGMDSEGPDR